LQRSLEVTEDELVAQARMNRELQDDLLRTRMVEFEGMSDRLYRVVRQAAKETGKSVRLDIVGGSIEVDRGVLDRMTGSFEHLLRNCVSHGIEAPDVRTKAGKEATGSIIVALSQEGNQVGVEFRDDGAGLNLPRIRAKGVALGLIDANHQATDAELANLIFSPGFSTADSITELSGRGVGMDVVRSEDLGRSGHLVQDDPAADHRGHAGRDVALWWHQRGRAIDPGRGGAPRHAERSRCSLCKWFVHGGRQGGAILLARFAAADQRPAGREHGTHALRCRDPKRAAAHCTARR
jgi:hypothetical protein